MKLIDLLQVVSPNVKLEIYDDMDDIVYLLGLTAEDYLSSLSDGALLSRVVQIEAWAAGFLEVVIAR